MQENNRLIEKFKKFTDISSLVNFQFTIDENNLL